MPEYDVLVIGGGPAGIGAALTSAKKGLKTCIIERHPMLGGNWTNGFVLSILGVYTYSGNTKIVGGIVDELVDRLKKHGGTQGQRGNFIPFRPDEMKLTLEEFVNDLGITIYYSSMLTGVEVTDSAVKDVEITGKNGITRISAKMYIDSTGDADLAQLSTKNSMSGKEENGEHQEATLPFRIANIDEEKIMEFSRGHPDQIGAVIRGNSLERIRILEPLVKKAKEQKKLYLPYGNSEFLFNTSRKGEFVCNATHVPILDFTDGKEVAKAISDARKQIVSSIEFLTENVPGFEEAYLMDSAPYIGLRETRRGVGEYILKKDDVLGNARFDDAIARCGHPIEIHDPEKGVYYVHLNGGDDSWYHIPYRSIVLKDIGNVFVIGRCLSAEFAAQASARVTGTAIAMGQAAATAGSTAIKNGTRAIDVDIKDLQEELRKDGAII